MLPCNSIRISRTTKETKSPFCGPRGDRWGPLPGRSVGRNRRSPGSCSGTHSPRAGIPLHAAGAHQPCLGGLQRAPASVFPDRRKSGCRAGKGFRSLGPATGTTDEPRGRKRARAKASGSDGSCMRPSRASEFRTRSPLQRRRECGWAASSPWATGSRTAPCISSRGFVTPTVAHFG